MRQPGRDTRDGLRGVSPAVSFDREDLTFLCRVVVIMFAVTLIVLWLAALAAGAGLVFRAMIGA